MHPVVEYKPGHTYASRARYCPWESTCNRLRKLWALVELGFLPKAHAACNTTRNDHPVLDMPSTEANAETQTRLSEIVDNLSPVSPTASTIALLPTAPPQVTAQRNTKRWAIHVDRVWGAAGVNALPLFEQSRA